MKPLISTLLLCAVIPAYAQKADSSQFYLKKGIEEKEAHRFLVAAANFDKAINFDPANKEAYLQNAFTQLEMKRTDAAKQHFTKVYELDPKDKTAIRELASLYYNYRQFDKAIEFAGMTAESDNSNRLLGLSYYQTEDYAQAAKYLLVYLSKNPTDAEATYTLGRNYLDMEEYLKAVPYYEKAVQLDQSKNVWMYEQGLLYFTLNDFKKALASFKNAAAHGYNQTSDFKENYGYASLYSGEYEAGESALMAIWQKKPGNKDILRDMAEILYQQKQYDKSLGYCQKLMEMDAKDGKALYQAGLCFQKKGEKDRGQQMCDKAIEMDPSLESLRRKKEMVGL